MELLKKQFLFVVHLPTQGKEKYEILFTNANANNKKV